MTTSTDASTEPTDTVTMTDSERSRIMASEARRDLLDVLDREEGSPTPVDLETLATAVAEERSGDLEPTPEAVERAAITLHHNHLPHLSEAGLLDYDATSNRVTSIRQIPTR